MRSLLAIGLILKPLLFLSLVKTQYFNAELKEL